MRIGTMLLGVAALHLGVACILYAVPWMQIVQDGVFASVPDFGDRAAAFWFAITGLLVVVLGACVLDLERRELALPAPLAPGLLLLTVAAVIPMPSSGGWLFALIAGVAQRRRNAGANGTGDARLPAA